MFQRLKAQDGGFTLIELLVAMTVSGLILGAVVTAFMVTMVGSQNLHERFVASHDAQLLSTYFPTDVQSANPTMINPDTTTGCGGPTSGTHVVRLQWTESDSTNKTVFSASYRLVGSTSGSTLLRYYCANTGSVSSSESAILSGATAMSHVVARDLADPAVQSPTAVNVDLTHGKVDLTLYSYRAASEERAGIPVYSYNFSAAMRTVGTFAPFDVTFAPSGSKVAGTSFTLNMTAKTPDNTAVDTTYSGSKTIVFSGASNSPNGTAPTFPASVDFTAGVGSATITLVTAGTTTLNVSQGGHSGSSSAITVVAGSASGGALAFSACPPATGQSQGTSLQVARTMTDALGNVVSSGGPAIAVGLTQTGGAVLAPASVSIAANGTTSGAFTSTNPASSGTAVTLTGASAGYSDATCGFTTTATTPGDTTPPPDPSVTGVSPGNKKVTLTFSDTEAGVTFECQFDGGTFSVCTSPTEYHDNQYDGTHDYGVRAVDAAGNKSGTVTVTVSA